MGREVPLPRLENPPLLIQEGHNIPSFELHPRSRFASGLVEFRDNVAPL